MLRYMFGIVVTHGINMEDITFECKDRTVIIPEKYANERYFIKTRCNNVSVVILITQKPNS